ncbi:kinase-like domain-containing protein, partial [Mycena leptocephala]
DMDLFKRRALCLLIILADELKILPEKMAIHGVTLLNSHAVKYGGFANIFRGTYTDKDGEQVEVALKVLKIFEDQSDDDRRKILRKFAAEALVWYRLKHANIVPLLGVDGTTFLGKTAMVSPWMRQGSVLNYMTEHSPSSPYAITLLNDVIQGLMYLHSQYIVHGDLCARNILIDGRQARLTDFGLATFIESDTSKKSSTHSGSVRWSAPELLLSEFPFKRTPASDVWAFGCVCCEIWTEGQVPFQQMSDGAIIIAFSKIDADRAAPYERPFDKAGIPMPDRLWDRVQMCFRHEAAKRPTVKAIADLLSEIKCQA